MRWFSARMLCLNRDLGCLSVRGLSGGVVLVVYFGVMSALEKPEDKSGLVFFRSRLRNFLRVGRREGCVGSRWESMMVLRR